MEVFIVLIIFGTIFGIAYLFFSTRNKERMALIENGAEAKIFTRSREHAAPIGKVLVLNLALLLMGVGSGIMIGGIMVSSFNVQQHIAMPGSIFLMAGIGLLVGFFLTKNLDRKDV